MHCTYVHIYAWPGCWKEFETFAQGDPTCSLRLAHTHTRTYEREHQVEPQKLCTMSTSLVPRPHHARARKGSGDIGADSWFCKLSNHVIICIGFYWHTCSHVMVRTTKKTLQCPQTLFLVRGWGLGTRLYEHRSSIVVCKNNKLGLHRDKIERRRRQ